MQNLRDNNPSQELVIFRLRIQFPEDWRMQFCSSLHLQHGSLDLFEPSPLRAAAITVLWRPFDELKTVRNDGQGRKQILHAFREQVIANLGQHFRNREISASREMQWCEHYTLEDRVSATYKRGLFKKPLHLNRIQRLSICSQTSRIFAVYASCREGDQEKWHSDFNHIFNSFLCHWGCSQSLSTYPSTKKKSRTNPLLVLETAEAEKAA